MSQTSGQERTVNIQMDIQMEQIARKKSTNVSLYLMKNFEKYLINDVGHQLPDRSELR